MCFFPQYTILSPYLARYPRSAGVIYQTYNDLLLAQQWSELEVVDLSFCQRVGFRGVRPEMDTRSYVVPCSLAEVLSMSWMQSAFEAFGEPQELYLAITSDDSSLVYYKLSLGMTKPPV
ncbi:hypothetical protein HETIRDRAFT_317965 [Heterobasidion irregulare TC 32-1]|uniref:tRNA-splicing endonuclease subunit Sen15 domain-containing protein n=1 Tax=Heterobasidion irregulare (strain TC 32-1) TaxID=747525 RepID=W4K9Y4_HETIT|nr:uncharacterized protein HETIRDRAFT_317965 [Heterobasidion irregulare TC 32-1]ETW81871.1 hypothetical protein HETIRDRAFT_317965 [Heterobasidion irregulare TC 32-1]